MKTSNYSYEPHYRQNTARRKKEKLDRIDEFILIT